MARDYISIAVGAAQASTARMSSLAHAGVSSLASQWRRSPAGPEQEPERGGEARSAAGRSKELIAGLIQSEFDRFLGVLGLAPESEVAALRQQLRRLERQLSEVRGDKT
ncbi:MAG: hypothetical protein WCF04_13310 [Candidatus Nanopelagicales bacterium]